MHHYLKKKPTWRIQMERRDEAVWGTLLQQGVLWLATQFLLSMRNEMSLAFSLGSCWVYPANGNWRFLASYRMGTEDTWNACVSSHWIIIFTESAGPGRGSPLCTQHWWGYTSSTGLSFRPLTTWKTLMPWGISKEGQQCSEVWSTGLWGDTEGTGIFQTGGEEAQERP